MKILFAVFTSVLFFESISCARLSVIRREPGAESASVTGEQTVRVDSFAWGLIGREALTEATGCGLDAVSSLDLSMTTTDVILTTLTVGIYLPHHAHFTCRKAPGLK